MFLGFSGAQPFDPSVLGNLALWLDGRMGVTYDGSNLVSQWDDQSGGSNHFAQGTGANQPLRVASAYGAVDVIRGQGIDDNLQVATPVSMGTAGTLFFVAKQGSTASNYMIADDGPTNGILSRFSGALIEWFNGAGSDRHTLANGPTGLHVYTIRQTNGVALQGWVDGVSAFGPVVPNAALFSIKSLLATKAAANGSAAQDFANVVAYTAALSDANRARVEAYLAQRNGL